MKLCEIIREPCCCMWNYPQFAMFMPLLGYQSCCASWDAGMGAEQKVLLDLLSLLIIILIWLRWQREDQ